MMYAPPASRLKKLNKQELFKFLGGVALMFLVYNFLGLLKTGPDWVLFGYLVYLALDEFAGVRYLSLTPQRDTIYKSLTGALTRIRQAALVSRLAHVAIWMILVFSLGINKTWSQNIFFWALILLPVLVAIDWWSGRKWSRKISEIKEMLNSFSDDQKMPESVI